MCSFIVTNFIISNLAHVNFYTQKRGPDLTTNYNYKGWSFVHNLLWITGRFTPQPFIDGQIFALFNGEIYNYERDVYPSDGYQIIPWYKAYGKAFPSQIDGELALVLVDFRKDKRRIILASDPFSTKPLFYAIERPLFPGPRHSFTNETIEKPKFATSSYASGLARLGFSKENMHFMRPNRILEFDLDTLKLLSNTTVFQWDLRFVAHIPSTRCPIFSRVACRQYKTTLNDWTAAFEASVYKRSRQVIHGVFIGLSEGYDSGAIHSALNKLQVPHFTYSTFIKNNYHRYVEDMEKNSFSFSRTQRAVYFGLCLQNHLPFRGRCPERKKEERNFPKG